MRDQLRSACRHWLGVAAVATAMAGVFGCDESTGLDVGDGVLGEWVWSGGIERTYVLHLPPSYDPAQASPLLVLLHGGGDTGAGFQQRLSLELVEVGVAVEDGQVVVFKSGRGHRGEKR